MSDSRLRLKGLAGTAAILGVAVVVLVGSARALEHVRTRAMAEAANGFLAVLTPEQAQRASLPFDTEERIRWHFIPPEVFPRAGVVLSELDERQRAAAHVLLKTGLSARGYDVATSIMALERVLKELENDGRFARDSDAYHITIFGSPRNKGTWAWRFEGHHLSLHFTVVGGSVTVSTPSFFGASPAEVRLGPQQGRRALGAQEDAAYALLQTLSPLQRAMAIVSDTAPIEIITGTILPAVPLAGPGLEAAAMTGPQRALLRNLLESHTGIMNDEIAAERWHRINEAGFDNVSFVWAGEIGRGRPHYYRVQGPTFLIELDNTQNDANHIHVVWRDFDGDFGRDLLREHLKSVGH